MKNIKLGDYIETLTDYHSGGSYKTLKENTKILYKPDYAVMIRTLNFERNDFNNDLIYCDKQSYDFLNYSHVNENDILMNKIANPGSVYIMPHTNYKCTCGMNLFLIRFKNINQRYMYYVMKNSEEYIKSKAHGTTTKTITKDEVRNLEFKIHDTIEEQNKIERFLTNIDNKIENNNKINNNLEEQIQLIYNYWFMQYNFLNDNNMPYALSGGKMEWNNTIKRNIPEGWQVKKLLDIASWESNSQPPKSQFIYEKREGYVRFIQNRDYDSNSYITYIPYKKSLKAVSKLDILIDKYGDAGKVRYGIEGVFNVALAKIKPIENKFLEYIRSYLNSNEIYNYLHNSCMASTRASLSEENLKSLNIVIPNEEILNEFQDKITTMRKLILSNQEEINKLTELKEFLLPMLMDGQINVDDIEI